MAMIWLLLVALAPLVIHLLVLKRDNKERKSRHLQLPPGPKKLPIIGNLHQLGELPHQSLWQLSQIHGPVMYLKFGSIPAIVVSSLASAREVLKVRDSDFCSRPPLVASNKIFYNRFDIGFAPYGEYWRQMRKLCIVELFSTKRVQSYHQVRKEEVALMIQAIASSAPRPIDLGHSMQTLANNVICRVAFNKRSSNEELEKGQVHRILQEAQAFLAGFYFEDYFPWLGWVDVLIGSVRKLDNTVQKLDSFYEQLIQEHLDPTRIRPEHEDIVDILLKLSNENAHLTKVNVKAILNDLFFAGTETISLSIVWAMSELARKPTLMNKVQEEIRTFVGPKGRVDEGDLHKLHFLKAVIKETLRLHCPAPLLLPRESIRQSKILEYDVLPNTRVYVNAWGISRDPNTWEDPDEFIPERFMNNSIDYHGHDFEYIPFGSGRRICPAINFAEATMELALANLLYSFEWKLPGGMKPEDIDMDEAPGLNTPKKSGLHLLATNDIITNEFNDPN